MQVLDHHLVTLPANDAGPPTASVGAAHVRRSRERAQAAPYFAGMLLLLVSWNMLLAVATAILFHKATADAAPISPPFLRGAWAILGGAGAGLLGLTWLPPLFSLEVLWIAGPLLVALPGGTWLLVAAADEAKCREREELAGCKSTFNMTGSCG